MEACDLDRIEKALSCIFLILSDQTARIAAIGPHAPEFGHIEHLGHDTKGAIGLIGLVVHGLVDAVNIGPCHVFHAVFSDLGIYEDIKRAAIFLLSRGFAVMNHMIPDEAPGQILNCWCDQVHFSVLCRVSARSDDDKLLPSDDPRFLDGDFSNRADLHAAGAPKFPILDAESLFASGGDAQAKTFH